MAYAIFTTPRGNRSLKKLPRGVKKPLLALVKKLSHQPHLGSQLEGEFHFLRSLHYKHGRVHYRIAYEIDEKSQEIAIHYADTRENFYRKLRRLNLKPLP